ncbi:MAG: Spi family protease inhibitor, partial [Bacteroidales bacterium]|nr:Spi family protease inhibitor [Bacteroidales bacterium]
MRRIIMLLFLLLFCHRMLAEHIDPKTAYQVATHYLNTLNDGKNCVQQELVDVTSQTPFTHFYVFKNEHSFVLVSADDRTIPILGYSTTETFVTGDLPENVLSWLQAYDAEIKHIAEKKLEASAETKSQWEALKKGAPSRTREVVVGPLIETHWAQGTPYGQNCPNEIAGCVATAMGQLMKYWNFPTYGTGRHSYVQPNGIERSLNFYETTYDW